MMQPALSTGLTAVVSCAVLAAQSLPELPAIPREVTGVIDSGDRTTGSNAAFTRPHVPALRTTADGRIGVIVESNGANFTSPLFTLMTPEKTTLTAPVLLSPAGSYTVSKPGFVSLPATSVAQVKQQFTDGVKPVHHVCLWDENPPQYVNGRDEYDVKVLVTSMDFGTPPNQTTQLFVTPLRIVVANPKTKDAFLESITKTGNTVAGPIYTNAYGFEPTIAGDGRLLVFRIFGRVAPSTPIVDIVYSYYTGGAAADPTGWTVLHPISHAPFDSRINGTTLPTGKAFGFALSQFRDAAGTPIADGEDVGGTYPWIDRDAKNLFLEGVRDTLHWDDLSHPDLESRYSQRPVPGDGWYALSQPAFAEDGGPHQGVSFLGLWSHGKLVQLDNLNNDVDYAVGAGDAVPGPQQREVELFAGTNGWLRMGYGRATMRMPPGENDNGNIIDSLENKLNYRRHVRPIAFRDVVWLVNNSKQTDELVFDDYVDPDAFLVVGMNGLLTLQDNGMSDNHLVHHSGWETHLPGPPGFNLPVRLQNAATAKADRWVTPKWGEVLGGRLEPAATGGVHGKGLWLHGTTRLQFSVDGNQPQPFAGRDWYIGLFVDCRALDSGVRRLLTFPDGTSVSLLGHEQVLLADATGLVVHRITTPPATGGLPDLLPAPGWAHLAFQVTKGGKDVEFLLNGLPYSRWQHSSTTLLQLAQGTLTVGDAVAGFRGWIDDLKVLAHTVDPETACNHAGGTLIGLPSGYSGSWKTDQADRFPSWSHDSITRALRHRGETGYASYANFHDYTQDHGAHRENLPAGTVHLRAAVHFPEGPLFHDAPRPDTTTNRFCISCHTATGLGGLGLDALTFHSVPAATDPRRQPSQPAALLHGWISRGLVQTDTSAQPVVAFAAPSGGTSTDALMMPAYTGPATLQTLSLLDATGAELALLADGDVVDPARLGTGTVQLRANLDSAQGSAALTFAGSSGSPAHAPYVVPPVVLTAGAFTATASPLGGTTVTTSFTVPIGTKRVIADFGDDYRAGSAGNDWFYVWNATGALGATAAANDLQRLHWHPGSSQYTQLGLAYPEAPPAVLPDGAVHGTGGFAGAVGASFDHFVLAGYRVRHAGYHGLDAGSVTSTGSTGNGLRICVYTQTGSTLTRRRNATVALGQTVPMSNVSLGALAAGDVIWIAVGPNGDATGDTFTLDFSVTFNELPF